VGVDRPLTVAERAALNVLLAVDFPGAAELRIQAITARVVGRCACGCPTVDLTVEDVAPMAEVVGPVPIEADVVGGEGGGLILFVHAGRLFCLEYWYVDDKPAEFPPPDRIRPAA
jgi:hypothetical protein